MLAALRACRDCGSLAGMSRDRRQPYRILGVEAGNKESSVALVEDGVLRFATREERHSRRHRDSALPLHALRRVLTAAGLEFDAIDEVVGSVKEPQLRAALGLRGRSVRTREAPPSSPDHGPRIDGSAGWHHLAHAALGFRSSGLQRALVVTIDGHGDDDTLVAYRADQQQGLERLGAIRWQPVSVGGVYEEATALLGFGIGGEGKLMGLAAWQQPRADLAAAMLSPTDARWSVRSAWLQGGAEGADDLAVAAAIAAIEAERRAPWAPLEPERHGRLAASAQAALEGVIVPLIRDLVRETAIADVVLGGGVALNCTLNGKLLAEPWLRSLWVGPDPADPGNAAGSALLQAWRRGATAGPAWRDGGLGAPWSAQDVRDALGALRSGEAQVDELASDAADAAVAAAIAADAADGRLLGIFAGRSEFGPRALGHRSIVGDPRDVRLRDRINVAKLREDWRPVAPSILADAAPAWLEHAQPSPFMLMAMAATALCRDRAPAAVHVDGSVRAQTVHPVQGPWHRAIAAFAERTGVPMLLNSSFNQSGEAIVESPADAIACARRAGLDVLYLDGVRVAFRSAGVVVDPRPRRPRVGVRGPIDAVFARLAASQNAVEIVAHDGPAPNAAVLRTLGLDRPADAAPSAWLAVDEAATGADSAPVLAIGPRTRADCAAGRVDAVVLAGGATEGFEALRGNLVAGRMGPAERVVVVVPEQPPIAAAAVRGDRFRAAWATLAEGVALAEQLLGGPGAVASVGQLRARLDGARFGLVGEAEGRSVEVRQGAPGALPRFEVQTARGVARLGSDGRLQLEVGEARRVVDTDRAPAGVWRTAAALASGGAVPGESEGAIAAADRAEAALQQLLRSCYDDPGKESAGARAAVAGGGPAPVAWRWQGDPPQVDDALRSAARATAEERGRAQLASALLRPLAVAAGVRPAASFENAAGGEASVLSAVAEALGLGLAAVDAYAFAMPARVDAREGVAPRQTLALSRDAAVLEQLAILHRDDATAQDAASHARTARALGAAYGVPPCCVRAFLQMERLALGASFTHVFCDATLGTPLPLVNPRPPGRLIEHFPCSLACAASERLAQRTLHAALADRGRLSRALDALADAASRGGADSNGLLDAVAWARTADAERIAAAWTAPLRAPLLYVDPTRTAWVRGGLHEVLDAPVGRRRWRVHGEPVLTLSLVEEFAAPEEAALQQAFAEALVAPLVGLARRGPWEVELPAIGGRGDATIRGVGAVLTVPAGSLRLQPGDAQPRS